MSVTVTVTGISSSLTLPAEQLLRVQSGSSSRLEDNASWGASWPALLPKYYYGHEITIWPAVISDPCLKNVLRLDIRKPRCSVFRPSVITHFNTIVTTLRDWFRRIRIRPRAWSVGFPHPPATAQITPSSAKLFPSNAVDCFSGLQNKTLILPLNARHASKSSWYFIKNKIWPYLTFLVLAFHWSLQPNRRFMMNMYSYVRDGITGPNWSRTSRSYLAVSNYTQVAKPLTSVRPSRLSCCICCSDCLTYRKDSQTLHLLTDNLLLTLQPSVTSNNIFILWNGF